MRGNTAKRSSRARSSFFELQIPADPSRERILSDYSVAQVLNATTPDQIRALGNLGEQELRVVVLELLKDNHSLRGRLDEQDEVVADLYVQISELEAENERVGSSLRRDKNRGARKSEFIVSLEEETATLLARLGEKSDALQEREHEVVGLRQRLASEHEKLASIRKWKEEQIGSLEQSCLDTQRLMKQLDDALKPQSDPISRFRQATQMVLFLIAQKRSAAVEEDSKKRVRQLRYLHDLWSRELGRGGDHRDDDADLPHAARRGGHTDTVFIDMAKEAQESKEELVLRLRKLREHISEEEMRSEEMKQEVARRDQIAAGLKLVSAIRRWLAERKLRTMTRKLLAVEAEAQCLREGLTQVLEHARRHLK